MSKNLGDEVKHVECKPSITNQQRVVYEFKCGLCDKGYIGYTMRHLHQRCEEHKLDTSSIKKHFDNEHGFLPENFTEFFKVLKKCTTKFDCLMYEMLLIREKLPSLNVQGDSVKAKLF